MPVPSRGAPGTPWQQVSLQAEGLGPDRPGSNSTVATYSLGGLGHSLYLSKPQFPSL